MYGRLPFVREQNLEPVSIGMIHLIMNRNHSYNNAVLRNRIERFGHLLVNRAYGLLLYHRWLQTLIIEIYFKLIEFS